MRYNHSFVIAKHDKSKPIMGKEKSKSNKKANAKKAHFLAKMNKMQKD